MIQYYKQVKKPTERQSKLKAFFVDREIMVKLKLNFIWSASKDLIEGLDFFEKREEEIHRIHEKMEEILTIYMKSTSNLMWLTKWMTMVI